MTRTIGRAILAGAALLAIGAVPGFAAPQRWPSAITTEPAADRAHPARIEVLRIPSGEATMNGIAYVPAGAGPHPLFVLLHGLPGNERSFDLAQTLRRAGWTVVMVHYRGAWGSQGQFSFQHCLEDARATLAYVRDTATAAKLGADPKRVVLGGHSMGGWVTAMTLADDPGLLGGVIISAGDFGAIGARARTARAQVVASMDDNRAPLAGVTGETMADELAANADRWTFAGLAPKLRDRRLHVMWSDDFVAEDSRRLLAAVRAAGGKRITEDHVATDHAWSDKRLTLQALTLKWLATLPQ